MSRRALAMVTLLGLAAMAITGAAIGGTTTDTEPPTLSLPGTVTAEATGPSTAVTYTATATDDQDPAPVVSCNPPSGDTFPVGTTQVSCTASDSSGNTSAPGTFDVVVQDTTAPTVTAPADVSVTDTAPLGSEEVTYDDSGSATDAVDGSLAAPCTPASPQTFAVGVHTITCSATDTAGNTGQDTFTVTVNAGNTPPQLVLPGTVTAAATGPSGASVSYGVSATDAEDDPDPVPVCSPPSGSTFPIGTTTVSCSVTDGGGLQDSGSFDVVVQDAAAPLVTVPASRTVEANGPAGAIVHYEAPTATDLVDGPIVPSCSRPSGSLFPFGTTVVTCTATDSDGNVGAASFSITVADTTPPVLTTPAAFAVQSTTPVPASDPRIQDFLASATATDIVDKDVEIAVEAPETFPLGTTSVLFTATDDAGNTSERTVIVTVSAQPVGPGQSDTVPPGNVKRVKAVSGNLSVHISWAPPTASDFHHVEITRTPGKNGAPSSLVYTGKKRSFTAKGLEEGVEYRFVIVAFDRAGNRSAGIAVVALAEARNLLSPQIGGTIKGKTKFTWRPVAKATYYNVQFWFKGKKQLSAHPSSPRYTLPRRWRYGGKGHRLTPGTWQVYVFPGFGKKGESRYGDLHVSASFVVKRR